MLASALPNAETFVYLKLARLLSELRVLYEYREIPGKYERPVWDKKVKVILAMQVAKIGATAYRSQHR